MGVVEKSDSFYEFGDGFDVAFSSPLTTDHKNPKNESRSQVVGITTVFTVIINKLKSQSGPI